MRARGLKTGFIVAVATLALAPAASAAPRYASTTGLGAPSDCTSPDPMNVNGPCTLERAVEIISNDEEVVVGPGTYTLTDQLNVSGDDVHGAAGQARPVISTNSPIGINLGGGAILRDLDVVHTGTSYAVYVGISSRLERATVRSSGSDVCRLDNASLVRDSLCWSTLGMGAGHAVSMCNGGMVTWSANLRNVTAIATGTGGKGVYLCAGATGIMAITAKNVIASGMGPDVMAETTPPGTATVTLEYSNYDTESELGAPQASVTNPGTGTGNQVAPPAFVDGALGNFHQASTSPTIDAGSAVDLLGTADFDGDARALGAAPDIGADEYVPPVPPGGPGTPGGTFDLAAAIKKCKKKFRKGTKARKKCIRKARARAKAS